MDQSVAVVSSSLSSLFLRFNPLKVLQPKRRLQQILASSPVPVPKPASGSGTTAPAATAPVAIPVPAPPAWDTLKLKSQRACSVAVAVAPACTVATKTKPTTAHRQHLCYVSYLDTVAPPFSNWLFTNLCHPSLLLLCLSSSFYHCMSVVYNDNSGRFTTQNL